MWYLPNLSITFLLKDTFGLSAAQTATFFSITVIPWLIKPVYGLISDFVPLFGQRRKSYFLLTSGIAAAMGLILTMMGSYTYWGVAIWSRTLWIVAGFIFFYNFSPSFGPALVYYATDVLQFSKIFLGALESLTYASGIVGTAVYFAFSKSLPFKRLIHFAIAAGVVATLAYLGYRGQLSAVVLSLAFGGVAMFIQLTFLDLAARVCPKQAEATFFALLMSVYNGAVQLSQITGGWLYDQLGFTRLIFISAAFTALCWLLVPLLKLDELELGRKEEALVSPHSTGS